jgi:hypothetical protein
MAVQDGSGPLSGAVWRRGARLGLVWTGLFFAATLVLFLALAPLGWSGVARALCAMALGPIIATLGIGLWWLVRRPALAPGAPPPDTTVPPN